MHPVKIATLIAAILGLVACDGETIDAIDQETPLTKTLQAEAYSYVEGEVQLGNGGATVKQFTNREYLYYPEINFDGFRRISVNSASEIDEGVLEFRLDAPDGKLIAYIELPNTGGSQNFVDTYSDIVGEVTGQHSLYVVARHLIGEQTAFPSSYPDPIASNIDYFTFSQEGSAAKNSKHIIEENTVGFCGATGTLQSEYEGAHGEGYIDSKVPDGWNVVTWKVNASESGIYKLLFRYADAGDRPRHTALVLNRFRTQNLFFDLSDEWSNWQELDVNVQLNAGDNTIQLASRTSLTYIGESVPHKDEGLPNIDSLSVVGAEVTPVECTSSSKYPLDVRGLYGQTHFDEYAPGWASRQLGTYGGWHPRGDSNHVLVYDMNELQAAAEGDESAFIWLWADREYSGTLRIGSNKTIVATTLGAKLTGNIVLSGSRNVVLRGLSVRGNSCDTAEECMAGPPAVYVGDGATNIWLNNLDIADGQNGNLTVANEANLVTVSKSRFHYTDDKKREFAGQVVDREIEHYPPTRSYITYMNNWWGPGTARDLPSGIVRNIHVFNNYFNTGSSEIHRVGSDTILIAENNYYDEPNHNLFTDLGNAEGWLGIGNEGTAKNMNELFGSVFEIPYRYTIRPTSAVKFSVISTNCGAGDTCRPPG